MCSVYKGLMGTNWEDQMVETEVAYHVTNQAWKPNVAQPANFNELRLGVANDLTYDGPLVGTRGVFFTTTKYGNGLPTFSPYPAHGTKGAKHYRVSVPLDRFKDYEMYYCQEPVGPRVFQIRLILVNSSFEKKILTDSPGIQRLNIRKENPFLYYSQGKWFTNDYSKAGVKYFVNFVVFKAVSLNEQCKWDGVERAGWLEVGDPLPCQVVNGLMLKMWRDTRKALQDNEETWIPTIEEIKRTLGERRENEIEEGNLSDEVEDQLRI